MWYVWLLLRRMSSDCCGWCYHKDCLLTQVNLTERTQRSASEHSMVETAATIQTDKHGLVTTVLIVVNISQLFVFVFMLSPLFIYSEVKLWDTVNWTWYWNKHRVVFGCVVLENKTVFLEVFNWSAQFYNLTAVFTVQIFLFLWNMMTSKPEWRGLVNELCR